MSYTYTLNLTEEEVSAIKCLADQYECYTALEDIGIAQGENIFQEHEMWDWQTACDQDDAMFPCVSDELYNKLFTLYDSIVQS